MRRGLRAGLIGSAVAGVFAAGIAVGGAHAVSFNATAAQPQATATGGDAAQWCNAYLGHVAADLGKSPADVQAALIKAGSQTIDDAVSAGKLTASQATALKAKLSGIHSCADIAGIAKGFGERHGRGGHEAGMIQKAVIQAAASALNLSQAQLQQDVSNGQTLHQIADAQHVTKDAFTASVKQSAATQVAAAQQAGKLTQQQAQGLLAQLPTLINNIWDMPLNHGPGMRAPMGGGGGGGGFGAPGPMGGLGL